MLEQVSVFGCEFGWELVVGTVVAVVAFYGELENFLVDGHGFAVVAYVGVEL